MSSAGMIARGRRWLWSSVRSGKAFRIAALGLAVLAAIIVLALLYGDLPEVVRFGGRARHFFHRYTYLAGFALLYVEESGIPLPAPGDVFVLYVGANVPRHLFAWLAAWLGLIVTVVLGATNLFFLSRKFGRELVEHRYAGYLHLNAERVALVERWFARYGMVAIIFGRHIPGFRVPITVAAGVFQVQYPVFAAGVAISTAIWAGIVLIIGINFGTRLGSFLRLHSEMYFIWGGIVVVLIVGLILRQRREESRRRAVAKATGR